MLEIRDIPQMRLHIAHMADDRLGNPVALFAVFNPDGMIDHSLEMASVFRDMKGRALCIVLKIFYWIQK